MTRPGADEPVEVEAIMSSIRAAVAERRNAAGLTTEEADRQVRQRLSEYGRSAQIDPALTRLLLESPQGWNVHSDYRLRSHRPGLAGSLIVLLKRLIRPFVRLYTDHLTERQAQLNLVFLAFLRDALGEIVSLRAEVESLKLRLQAHRQGRDGQ